MKNENLRDNPLVINHDQGGKAYEDPNNPLVVRDPRPAAGKKYAATNGLANKDFYFKGKAVSVGLSADAAILGKINRFAMEELTAEQVFVRKQILAHNGIDRDNERFPENLLDDFAKTLPGKSVLYFHDKHYLPLGLYFDASTENMSPDKFQELTGEAIKLPSAVKQAKVLWAHYYVVKTPEIESTLANIEGGVYRHWSIGFGASDLVAVKQDVSGPTQYYEYVAPGEAREGSLVWLGAQQGATSQKASGNESIIPPTATPEGSNPLIV